jgi:predicted dinucleotide-binding enzyme
MRIAVIGGTGKEGGGMALRWARAGHAVFLGSRDAARAQAVAAELSRECGRTIHGGGNTAAIEASEIAVLSVPYTAHAATLEALKPALAGRVLIDITVPLQPPKITCVSLPAGQSAAMEAQAILGAATPVVAAMHHVSAVHLRDLADRRSRRARARCRRAVQRRRAGIADARAAASQSPAQGSQRRHPHLRALNAGADVGRRAAEVAGARENAPRRRAQRCTAP